MLLASGSAQSATASSSTPAASTTGSSGSAATPATSAGPAARRLGSWRPPVPLETLSLPRGITSIALEPSAGRLLVSSINNTIYLYDTRWCTPTRRHAASSAADVLQFTGHEIGSYYVKSSFSSCDLAPFLPLPIAVAK